MSLYAWLIMLLVLGGGIWAMFNLRLKVQALSQVHQDLREATARLNRLEAEFEPSTWKAFWLTAVDGKTASEVNDLTGLSVASIYQAKSRVLKQLRQRLAELPE